MITPEIEPETTEDLLARAQAFFQSAPEPPAAAPVISEAQLAANRANAQLSSGPKSSEGKAKSSMNALKHGLTSQTVVLTGEDQLEYNRQLDSHIERLQPVGEEEHRLVQSLLDSTWRMNRTVGMESAILLKGKIEFENHFEDRTPAERESLILAEIYLKYEKSLRNLHIQEGRLRRCREKDQAELTRLQTLRKREEHSASEASQITHSPSRVSANGFDFSTSPTVLRKRYLPAA